MCLVTRFLIWVLPLINGWRSPDAGYAFGICLVRDAVPTAEDFAHEDAPGEWGTVFESCDARLIFDTLPVWLRQWLGFVDAFFLKPCSVFGKARLGLFDADFTLQ